MNRYRVCSPEDDEEMEDGKLVTAADHRDAERWAEWKDYWGADYLKVSVSQAPLFTAARSNEMEAYIERMIEEKRDLDDKRQRLREFKNTDGFCRLPWQEQERMNTQAHLMTSYSAIVGMRIEHALSGKGE